MRPDGDKAIVIKIGDRYFSGKTKTGRLKTAWSLAGAKLFGGWSKDEIEKAETFILARGHKSERCVVAGL